MSSQSPVTNRKDLSHETTETKEKLQSKVEGTNDEKQADTTPPTQRVRRMKAGFEPYQVKKRISLPSPTDYSLPTNKPTKRLEKTLSNRRSSGGSDRNRNKSNRRSARTSVEKLAKQNSSENWDEEVVSGSSSSSIKFEETENNKGENKINSDNKNNSDNKSNSEKESFKPADKDNKKQRDNRRSRERAKEKGKDDDSKKQQQKYKLEKVVDLEELRRKKQGISILECPCKSEDLETDENKEVATVTSQNVGKQDNDNLERFLVASPTREVSEKSVLDSKLDLSENPSEVATVKDINALFTKVKVSGEQRKNEDKSVIKHDRTGSQTSLNESSTKDEKHVKFAELPTEKTHTSERRQLNATISAIKPLYFQLTKLLERGFQSKESIKLMITTSDQIRLKYADVIIQFQEASFKHDFESSLWKSAFHNIIMKFREFLEKPDTPKKLVQEVGTMYWDFLQNGIQFLDMIMMQLQEQQKFTLEHFLNDPVLMQACKKQVKLALRSCHLLSIFIGDLERYVVTLQNEQCYLRAQQRYKQASTLAAKNGKSYNQLAVVAVVMRRKLDAIYYYARSLMASNPILSARDRLTAIFQEIKKKANLFDARNPILKDVVTEMSNQKLSKDRLRNEIWIFYRSGHTFKAMLADNNRIVDLSPHITFDGTTLTSTQPTTPVTEDGGKETHHDKITLAKVSKGFMIHFLYIHCKLYTNIGLEEFTSVHQESLSELTTLLQYPKASSLKRESLLKYMAINIFSIHNLLYKQQESRHVMRGTALDLALVYGMDMFSVLCKHCAPLLEQHCTQFLPAIKVWMSWMEANTDLVNNSTISTMLDVWERCCDLFTAIHKTVNENAPQVIDLTEEEDHEGEDARENVYLAEDLFLAGFKPLPSSLLYCQPVKGDEEGTCTRLRLKTLSKLVSSLDSQDHLCYAFDEKDAVYRPVQTSDVTALSPMKKSKVLDDECDADDEPEDDDVYYEDDENESEDIAELNFIKDLKIRKAQLEQELAEKEKQRIAALNIIEDNRRLGQHLSENYSTTIIADTNCYIDHLDKIIALVDSKDFTIVVPLVVINELDGLKKGSYMENMKAMEHRLRVQHNSSLAVQVLEERFARRDSIVKAVTSSGSEMESLMFRVEEFSNDRGTNDDVILSCCLKYCKDQILRSENSTNVIRRDVVLLTDDRNLRVKAHSRFVPTIDIVTFMKMAKFT